MVKLMKKRALKKRIGKPKVSKSIKTFVNRAIAVKAENKIINIQSSVSLTGYNTDNTLRSIALTPNTSWGIGQGVTQSTRVGNAITVKRIMFNYTLYPRNYDVSTYSVPKPGLVMLILCRVKNRPSDIPNSTDVSLLFQNGASASAPFATIEDNNRYFNKDYFDILKCWTHKLGNAAYTGTGGFPQSQYYANNDFNFLYQRKMNIAKYIPKVMKFQDGTTSQTGKGIFLLAQYMNADGSVLTGGNIAADLKYYINFEFEDS